MFSVEKQQAVTEVPCVLMSSQAQLHTGPVSESATLLYNRKVPRPYSGAEDGAPLLTGLGMTM